MGKKPGKFDDLGFVSSSNGQETAVVEDHSDLGFVPLKKKDESDVSPGSEELSTQSEQQSKPLENPITPEKERDPIETLKRTAFNTFRYQLPADLIGGQMAFEKAPQQIAEGTESINPFVQMDKAIGGDKKEVTSDLPDWLKKTLTYFTHEPNAQEKVDIEQRRNAPNPADVRRKTMLLQAYQLRNQGEKANENLVNSLDKAEDWLDYVNWAASAFGQAVGQIPAAVLTKGATAYGQEIGTIYLDGVQKLAQEKGVSPEEIIRTGQDEAIYPLLFGMAAGKLETIGAKGVMDSFGKKEVMNSVRSRALGFLKSAGSKEALTEGSQSVLEQLGVSKAAGKTWGETLINIDPNDIKESMAQGYIGGQGLHSVGEGYTAAKEKIKDSFKPKTPTDVIREQVGNITSSTDAATIENAAEKIQEAVDNKPPDEPPASSGGTVVPMVIPALTMNEGVNTGLVENSKGAVWNARNSFQLEKLGYSEEDIDNLSQEEVSTILEKNIEKPIVESSAKIITNETNTGTDQGASVSSKQKIFVYGTLQDPATRKKALGEDVPTTKQTITGKTKEDAGNGYSTIVSGPGQVEGQMMELTPEQVAKLDKYESKYERQEITLDNGEKAFAYHLKEKYIPKTNMELNQQIADKTTELANAEKEMEAKAQQLDKDLMSDQANLFGERKSTGGMFDVRANPEQRGKILAPMKAKIMKLKTELGLLKGKLKTQGGQLEIGQKEETKKDRKERLLTKAANSIRERVLQYFAGGGKIDAESMKDETGFGAEKLTPSERRIRAKEEYNKRKSLRQTSGPSLDDIVLDLMQSLPENTDEDDVRNEIIDVLNSHATMEDMMTDLDQMDKASDFDKMAEEYYEGQEQAIDEMSPAESHDAVDYLIDNFAGENDIFDEDAAATEELTPEIEAILKEVNDAIENIGTEENATQKSAETNGEGNNAQTTGEGAPPTKVTPPAHNETPPGDNTKKKSLLNRAFEGATEEDIKKAIEKHGLNYVPESHDDASQAAENFINEVGEEAALDAVRKNQVEDGIAAFIWANLIDRVGDKIAEATNEEQRQELVNLEAELMAEFDRKARSGGRFISALGNVYANSDFKYKASEQIEKYKTVNNGEISPELEKRMHDMEKHIADLNVKIRDAEKRATDATVNAIKEYEKRQRKKLLTPERKKKIDDFFDGLKVDTKKGGMLLASPIPGLTLLPHVWNGSVEIMRAAVKGGAAVADAIQEGIDYIKKNHGKVPFDEKLFRDKLTPAMEAYMDNIVPKAKVTSDVKMPTVTEEGRLRIPKSLIHDLVNSGIDNIEDLTKAVHDLIKDVLPDITHREVRDAITSYGKTINLNQEQINKDIRRMKRIGKLISGLEDVRRKMRPLRSGLQRDALSDEERRMQRELKEEMKDLPIEVEEQERAWKTALDAIKSRLKNQIADLEEQIATGKKTVKQKGTEYDLEAKELQARRDELKTIIQQMEGKQGLSDEQRIRMAETALKKSIDDLQRRIAEKDFSKKETKPGPVTPEITALKAQQEALRKTLDELKATEGVAESERLKAQKQAVQKSIDEYQRRIREGDFAKKTKSEVIADDELTQLRAEKMAVKHEFDKIQYQNELKNRSKFEKTKDFVFELWGLTRALRATGEFSFMLIQGGLLTTSSLIRNPRHAAQAFVTAMRHFSSEERSNKWFNDIKVQEWYARAQASKLAITQPNAKLSAREEQFLGGWVNHIWDVAGLPIKLVSKRAYELWKKANPVRAVERAGIGYLDTLRIMRYLDGEEMLKLDGKTFKDNKQDFKNMADVINTFSGRASIGPAERISKELSMVFFSPRNWASIIKQATPYAFYHFGKMGSQGEKWYKPSIAQKMAMADYMRYVGLTGSIVALVAALSGDDDDDWKVELDPTSSDFLKLKKGNTRVDPWGGRIQMIVLQARLLTDSMKLSNGEKVQLGMPFKSDTKLALLGKMVQNKLAPSTSIMVKYLSSHLDKKGQRVDQFGQPLDAQDQLVNNLYPIYWETIKELYADQPETVASFLTFLAFLGVGTQTYKTKESKKLTPLEQIQKNVRDMTKGLKEGLPKQKELMGEKP